MGGPVTPQEWILSRLPLEDAATLHEIWFEEPPTSRSLAALLIFSDCVHEFVDDLIESEERRVPNTKKEHHEQLLRGEINALDVEIGKASQEISRLQQQQNVWQGEQNELQRLLAAIEAS